MGVAPKFSISISIVHRLIQGKSLMLILTVNGPTESLNIDANANANRYAHCEWTLRDWERFDQNNYIVKVIVKSLIWSQL